MFKGVHVDNTAWAILVAIGSLGSGIVSSLGTTASMRRGNRDERRKEMGEVADAKVMVHDNGCKWSEELAKSSERNQKAVATALEDERHERSIEREADHARLERMSVEIVQGQKLILEHIIVIQTDIARQGTRLDAHDVEITRLRDGKNGGRRE